ncbi:MAG: BamA/TamA family outer membrane protein [Pirellulaceae bacterium]
MHNSKYRFVERLLWTRALLRSWSILAIVGLLSQTGCQSLQPNVDARPDSMNSALYRFSDDGDWTDPNSNEKTAATTSQKPVAYPSEQSGQERGAAVSKPRTIRGQSPQTGEGLTDAINRYAQQRGDQQNLPTFPKSTSEATLPSPGGGAGGIVTPAPSAAYPPTTPAAPQGGGLGVLGQPGALDTTLDPMASPPSYGYQSPGASGLPYNAPNSDYQSTLAPGVMDVPQTSGQAIAPGVVPYVDPTTGIAARPETNFRAPERIAPVDVYVQEARTGRIILGGSVNSDLGVAGNLIVSENNFDIRRIPRSWDDIMSGRAFKGGGQNFRLELMPGNLVERYTVSWTERNLLGYLPYSLSVGGFYYTRQFRDWTEQRLGGRVALGYEVTKDLAVSTELRMEDVTIFDPRVAGVQELDTAQGSNDLYTARFRISRDTRDNAFMATQGSLLELTFDQVFGEYDFSRGRLNYSRSFLMRERPDGTGRHVLATTFKLGFSGAQTPIFENFFAGGYSSLRGFSFRGAGPVVGDVQVGGEFMALGSVEYVFPLTADDMLRGVAFVDYGTVEEGIELDSENFRVSPGLGLRVTVPALGPAPLAFDFAYPLNYADNDDRQVFSFFMGFTRQ